MHCSILQHVCLMSKGQPAVKVCSAAHLQLSNSMTTSSPSQSETFVKKLCEEALHDIAYMRSCNCSSVRTSSSLHHAFWFCCSIGAPFIPGTQDCCNIRLRMCREVCQQHCNQGNGHCKLVQSVYKSGAWTLHARICCRADLCLPC